MLERPVSRTIALRADAEEVWGALTDARRLGEWFGVLAEIDPRPGGAVRFTDREGRERRGVVETSDPPRRLVFRWRELHGGIIAAGDVSTVEFLIERDGDGTKLVVTESPGILAASGAES